MSLDKTYSLQRFLFDVTETATRYDKFSLLNRNTFDYRGEWQWSLSPRISGSLSTDHTESVIGFEDITQGFQRNVRTLDNHVASVDGWLFGGWHLLGGVSQLDRKNNLTFLALPNVQQTSEEFGLRYVAESQSSVSAVTRSRQGVIPGQAVDTAIFFLDNEFTVRESEVNATWIASAKSTLAGRLTRIEYRYPNVPQRDFSGTAGEMRYAWTPTGRLVLNVSALRNISPWTPDTSTSFRVDDTLAFTPTWQISDKIRVRANASRAVSNYLGPVVTGLGPTRRDVLLSEQLAVDWLPHRKLTLSASLRRDRRSSNDAAFSFDATIADLSATLVF